MSQDPTLEERLTAARLAVATLERENGAAALDGKPFAPEALATARVNVDALEAAELESHRRNAEGAAQHMADNRVQAAKDARGALTAYCAAVTRCEAASKYLLTPLAG